MKKLISIILTSTLITSSVCFAQEAPNSEAIKYLISEENYDYGSGKAYVATDKATGELIPLSMGPLYNHASYAYMPDGGEFEIKKVEPEWFTDSGEFQDGWITEMQVRKVINGYPDGTFRPYNTLTRAEMAAIFCRMFMIDESPAESCYDDVTADSWYRGYIMALTEQGVFMKDTLFRPDDVVSREEFTAMLYRMVNDMGYIKTEEEYDFSKYTDYSELSEYAKKPYNDMRANGYRLPTEIIEHDSMDTSDDEFKLLPKQRVTRYECCQYLYDFIRDFFTKNAPSFKRDTAPDIEIPILDGSTSTYNITENIYYMYYANPENNPDMPKAHSKTTNSYKRLIDGEVEMIFVPDPGEEVKKYAEEKNVKLKYIPIAGEALIFFTGKDNPIDSITTEQLKDIYIDNSVNNWSELGGSDASFAAFCRNEDSGSHGQIDKFVLNGAEIHPDIKRERTSVIMSSIFTDLMDYERNHPGNYAIGYSLYYYLWHNALIMPTDVKVLKINGIEATDATIADETYPYTTRYYAVIRDDGNEKVEEFAKLMQSEFGEDIVRRSGYGTIKYPAGYPTE